MNGFIFIRRIGLFGWNKFRMCIQKAFVIESEMPDSTETVGDNTNLVDIEEVSVKDLFTMIQMALGEIERIFCWLENTQRK